MTLKLPLSDGAIIARVEGNASAIIDDETVIMSSDTGRFHVVAATGALIWERLDKPQTVERLVLELTTQFEIGRVQCRYDLEEFVASLVDRKLVTVSDPP